MSKDIIPLYINNNLINNLFTVVVQEFKETMTLTSTSEQLVRIDTPLGNIMKGRYVQGRFNLQLSNQYSRQMTSESISVVVWAFLQTKGILEENNLLKKITTAEQVPNIKTGDYVEFRCRLNKNPQIVEIKNLIQCLKMKQIFDCGSKESVDSVIDTLYNYLNHVKENNCIKCYTDSICNSDCKAIIPIQMKYMEDNLDYLDDLDINIMGKVIKVGDKNKDHNIKLDGGTFYDYLTPKYIEEFKKKYLEDTPLMDEEMEKNIVNNDCSLIEIMPLAMYI